MLNIKVFDLRGAISSQGSRVEAESSLDGLLAWLMLILIPEWSVSVSVSSQITCVDRNRKNWYTEGGVDQKGGIYIFSKQWKF